MKRKETRQSEGRVLQYPEGEEGSSFCPTKPLYADSCSIASCCDILSAARIGRCDKIQGDRCGQSLGILKSITELSLGAIGCGIVISGYQSDNPSIGDRIKWEYIMVACAGMDWRKWSTMVNIVERLRVSDQGVVVWEPITGPHCTTTENQRSEIERKQRHTGFESKAAGSGLLSSRCLVESGLLDWES